MHYKGIVQLDEDTGEHMLEFPVDLMAEVGWEIGDNITWTDNKDGSFTLSKSANKWQQLELSLQ
jgi:hypothetical protein